MKAIWNDTVIAQSDDIVEVEVEGNVCCGVKVQA